jgi:hypothetical protein
MKEKTVPETASRRPAAGAAGAALQDGPRLAAQRRQMEQLTGGVAQRVVQRVKDKPGEDALARALAGCVSSTMGACCSQAAAAYKVLLGFVDSRAELGAVLLTWSESLGSVLDIGNHTACTATWNQGTFVVDTTAGQFGGPEVFIGSVAAWQEMILARQTGEVGNVNCQVLSKPPSDGDMIADALDLKSRLDPRKPKRKPMSGTSPPGGKKPDKGRGEESGAKKSKCYLTSACVEYRGLPDDCHELMVLRAFRDGYLMAQPGGPGIVETYYGMAPALVDAIEASGLARLVYGRIYGVVLGCVESIEQGRPGEALRDYAALVRTLQSAFGTGPAAA